jgi:hypothetical protein
MRNYLIGAAMIAATTLLVHQAKADITDSVPHPHVVVCKTALEVQSIFELNGSEPRGSHPDQSGHSQ